MNMIEVNPLDIALLEAEKRALVKNEEMFAHLLNFAFNIGQKFQSLKEEQERLNAEKYHLKHQIKQLKALHKEEQISTREIIQQKSQAIITKIDLIIQDLEQFKITNHEQIELWYELKKKFDTKTASEKELETLFELVRNNSGVSYDILGGANVAVDEYLPWLRHWIQLINEELQYLEISSSYSNNDKQKKIIVTNSLSPVQVEKDLSVGLEIQMRPLIEKVQNLEEIILQNRTEISDLNERQEKLQQENLKVISRYKSMLTTFIEDFIEFGNLFDQSLVNRIQGVTKEFVEANCYQRTANGFIDKCKEIQKGVAEVISECEKQKKLNRI